MNLEHPIGAARNYLSRLCFDSLQALCTAGLQRVLKAPPSWEALLRPALHTLQGPCGEILFEVQRQLFLLTLPGWFQ